MTTASPSQHGSNDLMGYMLLTLLSGGLAFFFVWLCRCCSDRARRAESALPTGELLTSNHTVVGIPPNRSPSSVEAQDGSHSNPYMQY